MNEDALIALAIDPKQRSRYRTLLANPRKRKSLLDKLNHRPALDERRVTWLNSFKDALASIVVKPSAVVYLLSGAEELDGKLMSFEEAVVSVRIAGWGTIIGITPNLALYYGEQGERIAVIRKQA